MDTNSGKQAYDLAQLLWPLNRTLISNDTSKTISILISEFEKYSKVHKFRSGSEFGEWTIPKSWEVNEAYIADKDGSRVIDWKDNNLHLLNYSQSINTFCTNEELKKNNVPFPDDMDKFIQQRLKVLERDLKIESIIENKPE